MNNIKPEDVFKKIRGIIIMRLAILFTLLILSGWFLNGIFSQNKTFNQSTTSDFSYLGNIGTSRNYVMKVTDYIHELNRPLIFILFAYIDSLSITPEEYYSGLSKKQIIHEEIVAIDSSRFPEFTSLFGSEKSRMAIQTISNYHLVDEYQALLNHQTYIWPVTTVYDAYYVDDDKLIEFYRIIYDSCYVSKLIDKPLTIGKEWERYHDDACFQKAYLINSVLFDSLGFNQSGYKLFIETGGICGPDSAFEYWGEQLGLVFKEMHWTDWVRISGNWVRYFHQEKTELENCNFVTTSIDDITKLVSDFYLDQNFPNPFNPTTKITWHSPVEGRQTLKIYDVLGNEIATLVDEEKPTGTYEVEFDASSGIRNLVSGVYFYQLKVGNYFVTKKMQLIK